MSLRRADPVIAGPADHLSASQYAILQFISYPYHADFHHPLEGTSGQTVRDDSHVQEGAAHPHTTSADGPSETAPWT
ncbi:MAG: hypothetical protein R6U57_03545 [Anaerolineales bacterium]